MTLFSEWHFFSLLVLWHKGTITAKWKSHLWIQWHHCPLREHSPLETKTSKPAEFKVVRMESKNSVGINPWFPDPCILAMEKTASYIDLWFKVYTGVSCTRKLHSFGVLSLNCSWSWAFRKPLQISARSAPSAWWYMWQDQLILWTWASC